MKIFCDYPEVVKDALLANNPKLEFVDSVVDAELALPFQNFPIRLGNLLDEIDSHKILKINA